MTRSVSGRPGGRSGSSSSTYGRSASTTRASARRARSPADSVVPSSPSGVSRSTGSATRRSASRSWSSVAAGTASRRLSATVPGDEDRPLRQPRRSGRGSVRARCRRSVRAGRRAPRAVWTCRSRTGRAVVARAEQVLAALEKGEQSGAVTRLADDLPLFAAAPTRPAGSQATRIGSREGTRRHQSRRTLAARGAGAALQSAPTHQVLRSAACALKS